MTATFILSLDTEIAWGTDKPPQPRYASCFDNYRSILRRLIDLLDRYQIPATWAVVGHLFLRPDDPRALPGLAPESWYHAPYVLDWLRSARVEHEIGTHTFSHVYTIDPAITRAVWERELSLCAALHLEHGLTMRSLVYPRNQIAYLDSLPQHGIVAYRGVEGNRPVERRGLLHLLDRALAFAPSTYDFSTLRVNDQLVNLPASQFLLAYDGLRRWIPTASRVRQAHLGIEKAIRLQQLYHLWFHPFNLGTSPVMFDALEQILRRVTQRRDAGQLRILTMEQTADWVLGEHEVADSIIILASRDELSYLLVNHLAAQFDIAQVVFEAPHTGKMLRYRLKKLGWWKVAGQLAFLVYDRLFIRPRSRPFIEHLLQGYDILPPDGRLPVLEVDSINGTQVSELMAEKKPSVVVVSGTGIISKKILALAPTFINIHVGITPRYRGVHGGFWAVYEGHSELAGTTIHRVDPGVDTGAIIGQTTITVDPRADTYRTLPVKQYLAALDLMSNAVRAAFNNTVSTYTRDDLESQQWYSPTPGEYLRFLAEMRKLRDR